MSEASIHLVVPATIIAFLVTVAALYALRPMSFRIGLIDAPGGRKRHSGEVPIIGGIAMFCGAIAGWSLIWDSAQGLAALTVAAALLVGIGAVDDRYEVARTMRVLMQVAAILIMVYGGGLSLGTIGNPFGFGEILLGPFALIGTFMVAITTINAYNLVDGVDGLAGILATLALVAVAIVGGVDTVSTVVALTVCGAIVAFLLFNFPTKLNRGFRTFMGDAGSTFLGFVIVWVTMDVCQGENARISPVAALWFASIPVYDSLTCFVRRILRGKSPFSPGRDHFHHTLGRGGFGTRQKLAILSGLQALYVAVAIVAYFAGISDVVLFTAWSILGLTQHKVIQSIAVRFRVHLIDLYRSGRRSPEAMARRNLFL